MYRLVLLVLVIGGSIVGWLYWQQTQRRTPVVTGFVEADQIRVGSRIGGRITKVMVEEGERVRPRQPLFEIDAFDLKARLAEAEAQLALYEAEKSRQVAGYRAEEIAQALAKRDGAAATLDKLVAGPRPREINIAKEKLNMAEANLELAQSEYERVERLRREASAAKTEFDEAVRELKRTRAEVAAARDELALLEEGSRKEDVASARAVLAEAQAALDLAQAGYRAEDVSRAAAQVEAARARVAAIRAKVSELTVVSPCDCLAEAIDLRPGDLVASDAPTVSLLDTSRLWVRTYIPQAYLGRIRVGDAFAVRVDSLPDREFRGRVTFIAGDGEFTPRNIQTPQERGKQVFRMKLVIVEGADVLRVGMAVDVLLEEGPAP